MARIPSKQLHRAGSLEELQAKLSDRAIGFCDDDRTADICREHSGERKFIPLSRMIVALLQGDTWANGAKTLAGLT